MKLHNYRKQYSRDLLDETQVPVDPIVLFQQWFELALKQHAHEANAMVLSTVSENRPSARVVYLKKFRKEALFFLQTIKAKRA
jgi:pyridoxamine 5'-phosphate oxidase